MPASTVRVGDPVAFADSTGWWFVESIRTTDDQVVMAVAPIGTGEPMTRTVHSDQLLRRGDPAAVHRPEEFVGLTVEDATVWARALGWQLFGPGHLVWGGATDEHNRVRVWTDDTDTVVRAAFW